MLQALLEHPNLDTVCKTLLLENCLIHTKRDGDFSKRSNIALWMVLSAYRFLVHKKHFHPGTTVLDHLCNVLLDCQNHIHNCLFSYYFRVSKIKIDRNIRRNPL